MTTEKFQKERNFCIFDYYLNGVFLKWEEVIGQCPVLIPGQDWVVNPAQSRCCEPKELILNNRDFFE